jgi:DNA-binding transcriptional LysR family regulator
MDHLRHLRTFVAVADQGSVSKAAASLRIAQPALSRQIKDLEEALGLKLFDRLRRRLVLTGDGEQLAKDGRNVLSAFQYFNERAHLLRRGDSGTLKVAATPQMLDGVLSAFLPRYAKLRPNVQIKLTEAVGLTQVAMLEAGRVHLSISLMETIPTGTDYFEGVLLPPIEFLAVSHIPLKLGSAGKIDIVELVRHPLLVPESSFAVRKTFDAACRLAGLKPDISIESRSPQALLALAEAGLGVAVVPSVLPTHRYRVRSVRITHRRKTLREPLAIVWDKRRGLPPYARDFCDIFAAHMRKLFPASQHAKQTQAKAH